MSKREIIRIDEEKCTGCGDCIPNCPEGALQIIDGKARLISDLFCDGLGACIGHCPEGAITVEEREAAPYDERAAMENVAKHGKNTIAAHLKHLKEHGADDYYNEAIAYLREKGIDVPLDEAQANRLPCGCPGSAVKHFSKDTVGTEDEAVDAPKRPSWLGQWPVQIKLVPADAPYLNGADVLLAADCVPFAYPDFHEEFLKGKTLLVGCPKLDDAEYYREKLADIFSRNHIRSITCVHMEVPCCFGFRRIISSALDRAGNAIPIRDVTIGVRGEVLDDIVVASAPSRRDAASASTAE